MRNLTSIFALLILPLILGSLPSAFGASTESFEATENCEKLGGTPTVTRTDVVDVQFEMCIFDGRGFDSSSLYASVASGTYKMAEAEFLKTQLSVNPTYGMDFNCSNLGGQPIKSYSDAGDLDLCELADGSTVDSDSLARGPHDPATYPLNGVLK